MFIRGGVACGAASDGNSDMGRGAPLLNRFAAPVNAVRLRAGIGAGVVACGLDAGAVEARAVDAGAPALESPTDPFDAASLGGVGLSATRTVSELVAELPSKASFGGGGCLFE